ncbi:MAG: YggS family pyridoxal phosphate-dependent enzyme [Clostridiales bacterium]|nr:YggS family pyridoxal phosphate-dependent enzyme [Clostridiales bacterium]
MAEYPQELYERLKNNAEAVRANIARACEEAGRNPSTVTLVGVSKVFPVEYAQAAFEGGLKDLGENRVQELVPKIERLEELGLHPNWHLIGTLQRNKVKYIIGKTYLIHSVNTVELAQEIAKRSEAAGITTDILLQGNISGEESKHGFAPSELKQAVEAVNALTGVRLRGLMTMAPIETSPGDARPIFEKTREIYEALRADVKDPSCWDTLSMGMSGDYKEAILEGSTCVRVGTAIFGDRNALKA